MHRILISGISRGIGAELARHYLQRGDIVCGLSRAQPKDLAPHPNLHLLQADLTQFSQIAPAVQQLAALSGVAGFDTVFANAGTFGPSPRRADQVQVEDFMQVMALNTGGVKALIDACLHLPQRPGWVIASGSISGKRPRAGMLSYAVSKAALNALIMTYQLENPDVFFLPLGLCNVATDLSAVIHRAGAEFPELLALRQRMQDQPGYVATPSQRAQQMAHVHENADALGLTPGEFVEIRDLLSRCPPEPTPYEFSSKRVLS